MVIKGYLLVGLIISFILLVFYLVVEALRVPVLTDPTPVFNTPGIVTALIGIFLLIADVFLPVPSSMVMVINGALFGFLLGALFSLTGRTGSFIVGFILGTKASPFVKKFIKDKEMKEANLMLKKWGFLAIILSRPIPLLSETMAVIAGLSAMPFKRSLIAAVFGSLPEVLLFSAGGTIAANFSNTSLIFAAVIIISGVSLLVSNNLIKDK